MKNFGEDVNTLKSDIDSEEIKAVLENKDKSSKDIFGKTNLKLYEENVYENFNIFTKDSFGKVSYIIFPASYTKPIVKGITLQDGKDNILEKLNLKNDPDAEKGVFFRGEDFYIYINFAKPNAIFIPVRNEEKIEDFIKLTEEYLSAGDIKKYIPELTGKYPRYSEYSYSNDYVNLVYPHLGIKIVKSVSKKKSGIFVHQNTPFYSDLKNLAETKDSKKVIKFEETDLYKEELIKLAYKNQVITETPLFNIKSDFNVKGDAYVENGNKKYKNAIVIFTGAERNRMPYNLTPSRKC